MIAVLRTLIVAVALSAVVLLGFWKLRSDVDQRAIEELKQLNDEMRARIAQKEAMIERLGRNRRLAHLQVVEQRWNDQGKVAETDLLFIELDEDGAELDRQSITVPGDVLFVDTWTVKFGQEDVAVGHPLHGRTLVLFRRIYSDLMRPIDGIALDTPGAVPPAYATTKRGQFEQRVWEHFWRIATDAELAEAMGVRVAQGEVVYKPVREGQVFELSVDAAGGINLVPMTAGADRSRARGG
jgi:hypothetical protein